MYQFYFADDITKPMKIPERTVNDLINDNETVVYMKSQAKKYGKYGIRYPQCRFICVCLGK